MTDSTYDRIRKQECEGCRRYLSKMPTGSNYAGWHVDPSQHEAALRFLPCTAPSRDEVIERLAKAIKQTIAENLHLADGDNCTLRHLVAALKEDPNAR